MEKCTQIKEVQDRDAIDMSVIDLGDGEFDDFHHQRKGGHCTCFEDSSEDNIEEKIEDDENQE